MLFLGKLSKIAESPKRFILSYVIFTLISDAILIFLDSYHRDNIAYLLWHYKALEQPIWRTATVLIQSIYHYETSMIAFHEKNPIFMIFGSFLFLTILAEAITILLLSFKLYQFIKNMNAKINENVPSIQRMLYRMIFQKIVILVLFFFVPFLVFFLCIIKVFTSIYVSISIFALMPLYAPCSYVLIICNVKPYRKFVSSTIKRAVGLKSSTTSVTTPYTDLSKKRVSIISKNTLGGRVGSR